jgi:uncharacterized protein (AIM24 family)
VTLNVGFQQSLGAGIFGGNGFILQKVGGQGMAWLELSGELIMKQLAPGEVLRVHPGHVGAFQSSVGFNITTVPGIKNAIFGGDGIFLAVLQGPGGVAADAAHFAAGAPDRRVSAAHREPASGSGAGGALLGGIVGSILGGDSSSG